MEEIGNFVKGDSTESEPEVPKNNFTNIRFFPLQVYSRHPYASWKINFDQYCWMVLMEN